MHATTDAARKGMGGNADLDSTQEELGTCRGRCHLSQDCSGDEMGNFSCSDVPFRAWLVLWFTKSCLQRLLKGVSQHFSDTVLPILTALQLHIRGLKGEALLTVCVGASVGHAEDARASVLQLEVLVLELSACTSI